MRETGIQAGVERRLLRIEGQHLFGGAAQEVQLAQATLRVVPDMDGLQRDRALVRRQRFIWKRNTSCTASVSSATVTMEVSAIPMARG